MAILFNTYSLRGITFRNRIALSPMCQYSAVDGIANDWHLVHLGSRAVGGAALVITEATAVNPEGRISARDLGIWNDAHIEPLKRITDFILAQGSVPGIQLAHAGRKASLLPPWMGDTQVGPAEGGWSTVAPSALSFSEHMSIPAELTIQDICKIVSDFRDGASRAIKAGFKVLEIHGAHGYLIHQFLSPLSNQRTDNYGGNFDNRIRMLLEIIAAVREVIPEQLPLLLRISATDWVDGGWSLDESIQLAGIVQKMGVDLIDCSSGGAVPYAKIVAGPGYQVPFAAAIKKAGIPTGAVGVIVNGQQAEDILQRQEADMIFIAREMLRDPYFPMHAAHELGYQEMPWAPQYERARRK
jgi:2,4-dienoyl-CoA reductase-like NADH-dependent reductase (Old Yellow Enzyme family)